MADRDWYPFQYLAVIVTAAALFGVCIMGKTDRETEQKTDTTDPTTTAPEPLAAGRPSPHTFYQSPVGADLGGVSYVAPGATIHWRPEGAIDSEGATVAGVLEAVEARLQFVQGTPQAADRNARVLWDVMKALQHFKPDSNPEGPNP